MSRSNVPEDLLVYARRDRLTDEDERRLELGLSASRELSLLYEAGIGFDAEARLLPGDDARAAELVKRTLLEVERQPAHRSGTRPNARYFALSVACGVLLSVAGASAWQYASERWLAPQALERPGRAPVRPPSVVTPPAEPGANTEPAPPPSALAPEPATLPHPRITPVGPSASSSAAPAPDARTLFTRAAEARRRGEVDSAITLYEELGRRYPDSVEAQDARLLLGNLRLEQRSPRAALNQFESYGGGPLSLEALWGKAEALRKLNSPEERAVLEQLLREHPSSPYTGAAKKRLQQLSP